MTQSKFDLNAYRIQTILVGGLFFGFIGETGSGKTASMTWFAWWTHKRLRELEIIDTVKVFANYHLKDLPEQNFFWDYEYLQHPDELLEIEQGIVFGDEIWGWCLDSYETRTKAQKKYDKLMGRGRKRGLGFFASSQRFMRIEPNFRYNIHYLIFPQVIYRGDYPLRIDISIVNNHTDILEEDFFIENLDFLFQLYDTREEVKHLDEMKQVDYSKLAEEFIEWNQIDIVTQNNEVMTIPQKITQALVNLFLSEMNKYNDFTREQRKMLYIAIVRRMSKGKSK